MTTRTELARKIKRSLGVRGLSCLCASRLLQVSVSSLSHWCTGYSIPTVFNQKKLLDVLAKIDEESPEGEVILLTADDFAPFNERLLARKRQIARQNMANYRYSQKDKEIP